MESKSGKIHYPIENLEKSTLWSVSTHSFIKYVYFELLCDPLKIIVCAAECFSSQPQVAINILRDGTMRGG